MEDIYTLCKGRDSDKQTTKPHFRYASHVAFRYKTDCETRICIYVYIYTYIYIYYVDYDIYLKREQLDAEST